MSPSKKNTNHFLKQGSILAAASLISRMIGMLYRIPMTNILGDEGSGIYSVAFEIYDILLIISSYSLPLAVSKMVSARNIRKEYKNSDKIFKCTLLFACITGIAAASLLFFGSGFIEKVWFSQYTGLSLPLKVLAPTIFIVAVMGVIRGFFQGKNTMMPTAISQVIDQIVNAFVSVYASYSFMMAHNLSIHIAGWGAAGGTLGTFSGSLASFIFLLFIYMIYLPTKKKQLRREKNLNEESIKSIYYLIFTTIIPIILSQTVYQISGLIDFYIFGDIMGGKGISSEEIKQLTGVYSTKYRLLLSVPIAIATAIASSMIPSIVASFTTNKMNELTRKINSSVKFNMIIAFPCVAGLTVLGQPIIALLFPTSNYELGGKLLMFGASAVLFYALSTITSAALQSINYMRLPVIHSLISLIIHIAIVFVLLMFTNMGIYSLIIGNISFPLVVSLLNYRAINKYLNYKQERIRTFCIPFLSSFFMGIATLAVYKGVYFLCKKNSISVLLAVLIAVLIYFVCVLLMKGITQEELYGFPMGKKIAKIAKKCHLI